MSITTVSESSMTPTRTRASDWQTWILGALMSLMFLLLTWGYNDIRAQIMENRSELQDLQKSGSVNAREKLAEHDARIATLERMMEKNDADHARILAELQLIRESIIKRQ